VVERGAQPSDVASLLVGRCGALLPLVAGRDQRDAGQAAEAEHADTEPDEPQAGKRGDREGAATQPSRTAIVVGDEDRALRSLNVGGALDDRHPQIPSL
jgi:hypothetical protein